MVGLGIELGFLLILILANGVFALSEIALVSSRKARLQQWAEEGKSGASAALELSNDPTRFLSTVQIGITLVGTIAGVFSGASIAEDLGMWLNQFSIVSGHGVTLAMMLVVMCVSYLSLVLGELAPKRIGLNSPERIICAVAAPMNILSKMAAPGVWLLTATTELIMALIGLRPSDEPEVTEEEIRMVVRQGAQAGVLEAVEHAMVDRVLTLGDRKVSSLMTPRRDIVWLDLQESPEEIRTKIAASNCSRFPVREGNSEQVLGVIHVKDLLAADALTKPLDMRILLQPAMYVPESTRALKLLEQFRSSPIHMALIIDEYGSLQGLVTPADIMEAIVGDITSVEEREDPMVVRRDDGSWLIDGTLPIGDLRTILGTRQLSGEEDGTFETLGGFVMSHMGKVPATGDRFSSNGFRFEVVDMDGRRVDKVLVSAVSNNGEDDPISGV